MNQRVFNDRTDAALQLLKLMPSLDPSETIVLGIPRGGVPMAALLSKALHIPLDILLIRKLATPENPEYAIGAVSPHDTFIEEKGPLTDKTLNQLVQEARILLQERNKKYRQQRPFPDLRQKTVILVDDGIATGRTLLHAIALVRREQPSAIWVATPVSSPEAAARISKQVDQFICLHQPTHFIGVGQFYRSFPSVTDEEVVRDMAQG
ncbi:MAG: phosphoribosyltransferase [Bacteroidota bacterium]